MPITIDVDDPSLVYLNERAAEEIQKGVLRYAKDLLREAGRLEATTKSTGGDPEITSTMVKDAGILLRRGYAKPARPWKARITQIVAMAGGLITGILADKSTFESSGWAVVFVVVLTVTLACGIYAFLTE